jgi:hypothetical protein
MQQCDYKITLTLASPNNTVATKYQPFVFGSLGAANGVAPLVTYEPVLTTTPCDGQQINSCLLYFSQVEFNAHQAAVYNKMLAEKATKVIEYTYGQLIPISVTTAGSGGGFPKLSQMLLLLPAQLNLLSLQLFLLQLARLQVALI